ncbi:rod-binding protein [Frigidibacter sp.]|uniref:rod-binding protein n=1 Tax=Frigidibacter sp. TaxID=2586418 RepID=UPI002736D3BE|nr:rod-binding protein [Frigidibacter sp.]MDP3341305.1 rod-binding protein [Frigidibacter sp.]
MIAAQHPAVSAPPRPEGSAPPRRDAALWAAAQDLETAFLAEMLAAACLGAARGSFGGGAGEEQFASFLRREQAGAMVQSGGIGLAETLYEALKETRTE